MMTPKVRPARPGDLQAITNIYAHAVVHGTASYEYEPPSLAEMKARYKALVEAGFPYLVAVYEEDSGDGRLFGYAYAGPFRTRPAYRFTVEDSIYLAPWATGQGAGKELLGALLEASRTAGVREVIAVIADSGDPSSIALHKKLGFEDGGRLRQVGHKHGRDIATVLLQCSLR